MFKFLKANPVVLLYVYVLYHILNLNIRHFLSHFFHRFFQVLRCDVFRVVGVKECKSLSQLLFIHVNFFCQTCSDEFGIINFPVAHIIGLTDDLLDLLSLSLHAILLHGLLELFRGYVSGFVIVNCVEYFVKFLDLLVSKAPYDHAHCFIPQPNVCPVVPHLLENFFGNFDLSFTGNLEPWVFEGFLQSNSLGRMKNDHPLDQVLGFCRDVCPCLTVEVVINHLYVSKDLCIRVSSKRQIPAEHSVEHHSKTPDVAFLAVSARQNFWSHVVRSPHHCLHILLSFAKLFGKPKVN